MMKEQRGYQIIEPTCLARLLANSMQAPMAVAVLEWMINKIKTELPQLLEIVDIEVVAVTYFGSYPAIGLHYKNENARDCGAIVSNFIETSTKELPFNEFLAFVGESRRSWDLSWQKLREKQ